MNEAALEAARAEARATLAGAPDGHLPRAQRMRVKEALGPDDPSDPETYPRVVLGALAARRALPVWDAERSEDGRPELLLGAAVSSLETVRAAREPADAFELEIDDAVGETLGDRAGMAARAATAALAVAEVGELYEDDPAEDDHTIDPELWAPEFCAELALAGLPSDGDAEARRAFWTWWLDEAVDAARGAGTRPV